MITELFFFCEAHDSIKQLTLAVYLLFLLLLVVHRIVETCLCTLRCKYSEFR